MKKSILIFFLCLATAGLFAQTDTIFEYSFGGIQNDVCNQIRATPDNGYIMVGTTNSFGHGSSDFYVIKVDSLFHHQWSAALGGPEVDEGYAVTPTLDHGYAFLGFSDSYGAGGYDILLIKTDSAGKVQWQQTYGGSDWDFGYGIRQTNDSGYVICGQTFSYGAGYGDMYILRTDKNGDTLWTRALGDSGYNIANSLCVQNDSLYYIVGSTTNLSNPADTNLCLVKINNKGTVELDTTFRGHVNSVGRSIESGALHKGMTISGYFTNAATGLSNPLFIMLDSSGHVEINDSVTYGSGSDYANDAMQCLNDSSYITACTGNSSGYGEYDMLMLRMNWLGWWILGPYEGWTQEETANSCAISNTGQVVFAGASNSYPELSVGLYDVFVCRYKSDNDIIGDNPTQLYHDITLYQDTLPLSGINEQVEPQVMVKVFPNPVITDATVMVQAEMAGNYWFSLYDIAGKCIIDSKELMSSGHGQAMLHFAKGDLQAGAYLFKVTDKNNNSVNGKIIIE
ncbi:MAG: T9SS type A sorting domain-containing protein [Bacteroidia bacterium]